MRISILGCVMVISTLVMPFNVLAQEQPDPFAANLVVLMKEALKLSELQTKQVTALVQQEVGKTRSFNSSNDSQSDKDRRVREFQERLDSQLGNYLTAEQLALWRTLQSKASRPVTKLNTRPFSWAETSASTPKPVPAREQKPSANDGVLQSGTPNSNGGGVY